MPISLAIFAWVTFFEFNILLSIAVFIALKRNIIRNAMSSKIFNLTSKQKIEIGRRIEQICKEAGWDDLQSYVRDKFKDHISPKNISDWTTGKNINIGFIIKFCEERHCTLDFILDNRNPKSRK